MSDVVNIQINTAPVVVNITVLEQQEIVNVTAQSVGLRGPKGDKGDNGETYQCTAGENLSGNRVVYIESGKAYYFDPSKTALYGRCLGITTGAALQDATVTVQMAGVMNWAGTPLTPGALYYAGASGQLTTNTSGLVVVQRVGHAIAINKLKINFDLNIITI